MEKQRKYELTKEDLETLIFLAANRICDQKKTSEEKEIEICGYAAEVTRELIDHLTGENPFDQEQMELVDAVLHKSTTIITEFKDEKEWKRRKRNPLDCPL